jgi:hypothetical protein
MPGSWQISSNHVLVQGAEKWVPRSPAEVDSMAVVAEVVEQTQVAAAMAVLVHP